MPAQPDPPLTPCPLFVGKPRGWHNEPRSFCSPSAASRTGRSPSSWGASGTPSGCGDDGGRDAFDTLVRIECAEGLSALETAIEEVLSDHPRSGCPGTFAPDQIARILAVACEPPADSGRPVTHWTPTELAEEVVARGIVPSISVRHVGRFLKVPPSNRTGAGTG